MLLRFQFAPFEELESYGEVIPVFPLPLKGSLLSAVLFGGVVWAL
jgi:hypothetical protein